MAEREPKEEVSGILTEEQKKICIGISCPLRSDFIKKSQCQPKALLDGRYPTTAGKREKRVKEDYGSKIPKNCTLEYHKL